jgi:iron-sulfur cluster assembly accessory protein
MTTVVTHNPTLKLTSAAIGQLKKLIEGKQKDMPNVFLRIFAAKGCAGIQYGFSFADQKTDEDCEVKAMNVADNTPISLSLLTDKDSALLIDDATIDFTEDTKGPRFIVNNPNDKGGGCAGCAGSCGSSTP